MIADLTTPSEPKRRFPEFIGRRLHAVRFQDVTAESNIRNGEKLPPTSVMGVRKVEGIVPMEEGVAASDISRYEIVRKNWFAYNPMRLNIGSIARWHGDSDILVSPDYVVFQCLEESGQSALSANYLDHFRQSDQWDAFVTEAGDGGVRVRIYYNDISQLQLSLPDIAEQQKIADCLGSLDDLIAAERRNLKALLKHKQGLMQQLFPLPGETVPRLRFPEFSEEREWEEEKLDDLAKRGTGHTPNKATAEYYNGGIKWVSLADSKRLDRGLISETATEISEEGIQNSSAVLHPAGSVILSRDAGVGKSAIISCAMAVSQHFIVWTCDPAILSNWFLYYQLQLLKPLFERIATGSTIKTIGLPFFNAMRITVPRIAEQQRIATCLSSMDEMLAAQSRKVDGLMAHKQGLLQQLFPSLKEESR
jgi:type I restriction enzyme S subunit